MAGNHILIIGGGAIGMPVARHFCANHEVTVIKRSPLSMADENSGIDIHPVTVEPVIKVADIQNRDALSNALPEKIDYALVCVSPSRYTEDAYRLTFVQGVNNLVMALHHRGITPKRVFFVSSTSVYHQDDGSEVDENSVIQPESFAGQHLKTAESLLTDSSLATTCVRFSGIYGGNRSRLINQVATGNAELSASNHFTNRIHESDCIRALCHLMQLAMDGKNLEDIYLATDSEPVRINTILQWLAARLKSPELIRNKHRPDYEQEMNKKNRRRPGSKRCSNRRLLATGFRFVYPTYKEGYTEMLGRFKAP
ncbi:MAG: hypothetical protein CSB48_02750 [Proteobacteria bacterium]|nr:MAG: hypothetical protein CSB48_02750 [Pseudomonadota bacterium]